LGLAIGIKPQGELLPRQGFNHQAIPQFLSKPLHNAYLNHRILSGLDCSSPA
jgi:hypothetical protein